MLYLAGLLETITFKFLSCIIEFCCTSWWIKLQWVGESQLNTKSLIVYVKFQLLFSAIVSYIMTYHLIFVWIVNTDFACMKMWEDFSKAYGNVRPQCAGWAGICRPGDESVQDWESQVTASTVTRLKLLKDQRNVCCPYKHPYYRCIYTTVRLDRFNICLE